MIRSIKQFFKRFGWPWIAIHLLFFRKNSYLQSTGWFESIKRGYPCRPDGSELPWINYPFIRLLEDRLTGDLGVFEFGSGFSTLFFARLVRNVISVENDISWFEDLKTKLPGNVTLLFRKKDKAGMYCRSILENGGKYDLVLIDGKDRVNCMKQAVPALSARGVILLDDSDRPQYAEGIAFVRENGFRALSLEGLKPTGDATVRCTLFYRENNCLGI
jgi:hypothetical protein